MEEEDYDDDEDGAIKSTRTRESATASPGPPIVYRYQLRPTSSGRRSNAAGPGSDAGSVALSDKYKRLGRSPRPRSDDQGGEDVDPGIEATHICHMIAIYYRKSIKDGND